MYFEIFFLFSLVGIHFYIFGCKTKVALLELPEGEMWIKRMNVKYMYPFLQMLLYCIK